MKPQWTSNDQGIIYHCNQPASWYGDDVYCAKCQAGMFDDDRYMFEVTFRGEFFTLTTVVLDARDKLDAIEQAKENLIYQNGWDMDKIRHTADAEADGKWQ